MKNILVTGGCGFIASNFLNYMIPKYKHLLFINIDSLYYCANVNNITKENQSAQNYKFIKGNICSEELLSHILEEYQIDTIMHFAAQSHVDNSFSNPLQYTRDNIVGTHTILECCRKWGKISKFIHVSTDEVYGENNNLYDNCTDIKNEKSILNPTNPYSATKASAEMIVNSYVYSYKMPIIITRGNNVYGPNQYPEKLIPKFIKLLNQNKRCTIHGNGGTIRSFLHVDDVSKAFELILNKGKIGEIYNIGTDDEYSVMDIAKKLVKLIKNNDDVKSYVEYVKDRPYNDKRYNISFDKLLKLGWKQTINIDKGLHHLVSISNFKHKNIKVYIVGHKGWIGGMYKEELEKLNIEYCFSEYRAESDELLQDILLQKATHILCCMGRTHGTFRGEKFSTIDYLENKGMLPININDNLYSPLKLANFCEKYKLHFTYIGTGCIYEYDEKHTIENKIGFTERDKPNFFGSSYSIVKGFTNNLMNLTNTLHLRIRMPITNRDNPRNFITKITTYEKICSIQNSMTVLPELIPISIKMMKEYKTGAYNFTNPGTISHNEILEMYRDLVDPNFTWKNFTVKEQDKILLGKRSNNLLNTDKLEKEYKVLPIKESVYNCLLNYLQNSGGRSGQN